MSNNSNSNKLAAIIRSHMKAELQEWLGNDLPEDGTDDHDEWLAKMAEIEDIQTLADGLRALVQMAGSPTEVLEQLGVTPNDFTPTLGELYDMLGQDLPPPPSSGSKDNEELADTESYWVTNIGRLLMQRWDMRIRSLGIAPQRKADLE